MAKEDAIQELNKEVELLQNALQQEARRSPCLECAVYHGARVVALPLPVRDVRSGKQESAY